LLSEQNKRKTQFTITLLVAFILFIIAATSIIVLLYKRKQQQRELLEYKISDIQSELNKNKADLQNVLSNIIQKNEQIKKLKASTKEFEKEEAKEELLVKDQIQSLTLLTESDLSQFNTLFDTAYPNFQNKLIDKFPTITNAEMRLAMLLKLNIDKESIATILGISPESVRKTNLRLRTKLKLKTTNELRKFLNKY
jgi:DNA-binding CsgD family transcriptional regulator